MARGLESTGGWNALDRAGGLTLDGDGKLNLGTLLQGQHPFEGAYHIPARTAILADEDQLVHGE